MMAGAVPRGGVINEVWRRNVCILEFSGETLLEAV